MDWSSKKSAWTASAALVVVLMVVWGVMSLGFAYNASLERMSVSFDRSLTVASLLDNTMNNLDHLGVEQQAFLSTGNSRFHDGVWESALALENDLGWLDDAGPRIGLPRTQLGSLRAGINQALQVMARSYDIRDTRGKAAALVYYDANEAAISGAKTQANELKTRVLQQISDGLRARRNGGLSEVLFHGAPRGITVAEGAAKPG
jgi:hypothetical protein